MIQRVQSIYWFISAAVLIAFLFLPMFSYGPNGNEQIFNTQDCTALSISTAFVAFFSLFNIFLFKNRPLQIKISWFISFLLLVNLVLFMGAHYYFLLQGKEPALAGDLVKIQWPVVLPILALVANLLATRGVKADEKLVSASDRLR